MHLRSRPKRAPDGRIIWDGVQTDITLRKLAEIEREASIKFLRLANESSDLRHLIKLAVEFFKEQSGCEAVGIRLKEGDDYPYYEVNGLSQEFVLAENELCSKDLFGEISRNSDTLGNPVLECMCGNVISGRFNPEFPFFTEYGSFWTNSTTKFLMSDLRPFGTFFHRVT